MDGRTAASSFFFFSHILSFYNCPKGSGIKLSTDIVSPASLYCLFLPLSLIGFISVVTTIPHECKKAPFIIRSSTGYEAIGACSSEQLLTAPLLMHLFFLSQFGPFPSNFYVVKLISTSGLVKQLVLCVSTLGLVLLSPKGVFTKINGQLKLAGK